MTSVAFSPDGATLASGGGRSDNLIRLWQVKQGTLLRRIPGHSDSVLSVAMSPDGTKVASGSMDRTLRVWRVADGTRLWGSQPRWEIGWGKGSLIALASAVLAFLIVRGLARLLRRLLGWAKSRLRTPKAPSAAPGAA